MYNVMPCTESDKSQIIDGLVEYNLSNVPATQEVLFADMSRKIVDDDGKIMAGAIARMYGWNCVYVDSLWVDKNQRGKGIGKHLLTELEKEAKEKGAYLIHLDTFDFQAKGFYEKLGYTVFGVLEDCPKGHCRYYLKKELTNN